MAVQAQVQPGQTAFSIHQREAKLRSWRDTILYHLFVGGIGLLMLYPVIWLVASSFKAPDEVWTKINWLIPDQLLWSNYTDGWRGFGDYSFTLFYRNSFFIAGIGTLLSVSGSAVVAYGFARIKFNGSKLWFGIMMITLMLPAQVLLIPQYIIFSELKMINSFLPLLLPRFGGEAFFIFMMMQFIRGIPVDLDEAAMIDGCGKFGIFYRIILPNIIPALVTASIFSFYWTWEDFLGPLIYLTNPSNYTVSVALRAFSDPGGVTNWGAVFAMLTLSLVPVFLIFVFFQRYLVQGIATTGLKG